MFLDMKIEEKIQEDIKAAMKAKDTVRLNAVRAIKSAILLAKTAEGGKSELEDSDIIKLIHKLAKQRNEAAEQYLAGNRQDLADNEKAEALILEEYLPKQLSEEELEKEIKLIIEQLGASTMADMGKVMGAATKKLSSVGNGKTISDIVKRLLSQ